MVNVLIPTKPDDAHAIYVKLALEKKGHQATLWYTADFPEYQKHSFRLQDGEIDWQANGLDLAVSSNRQFDVVWLRRPRKPMVPDYLHDDDMRNARYENGEFYKYFWQAIAPHACWVNPVNRVTAANCKLRQLQVANAIGLLTPDSLFSNDPLAIREFIAAYPENEVIFKTIFPVYWVNDDDMHLTYTNVINEGMLPSDPVLQATPAIYQEKIDKAYELRVMLMGNHVQAVKLNSQANPHAKIDWRSVPGFDIEMSDYQLPDHISLKCRILMEKLGIKFGCFDFIVTPEQEYYFLEVNEQGQFLWIEETNPDIKMLDAFTNFLIECGGGVVCETDERVSLTSLNGSMHYIQKQAMTLHKDAGLLV